ncbi:MAG: PilZ domain-containing protein [Desulfobacula sp.]|nr:PilZ domain-containing protein [Desulfobacula sp.]
MPKKSLENQIVERRKSPRQRLKTMVKVDNQGTQTTEESVNHSLTGLFIKCSSPEDYKKNSKVGLSFKDENGVDHDHSGWIIRTTRNGVAIQYI